MAISSGPSIVKDGLILDLDIANKKSFIDPSNNNLIDAGSWRQGIVGGTWQYFGDQTNSNENALVSGIDPYGNENVLWETRPSGDGGADGGWTINTNVDNTKLYRFSVWVRRITDTSSGDYYFGLYGDGGTWGVKSLANGNVEGNPYWICSSVDSLAKDQWYLLIGHCYPVGTTGIIKHRDTGIYLSDGTKFDHNGCNIGGDCKMLPDTTILYHRAYHFYCSDNTTRLHFSQPRIDLCDGNEPSIAELLKYSSSMIRDTSGYENHHLLSPCDIFRATSPTRFSLDGNLGFVRNKPLNGATNDCTVVLYYKTTDTTNLWVQGDSFAYYLSATTPQTSYYHDNAGSPTNYIDLKSTLDPYTPINYADGQYHMWEAKGVDFSNWNIFKWFLYGPQDNTFRLVGDVSKIMVYNRPLTANESRRNFLAFQNRFDLSQ